MYIFEDLWVLVDLKKYTDNYMHLLIINICWPTNICTHIYFKPRIIFMYLLINNIFFYIVLVNFREGKPSFFWSCVGRPLGGSGGKLGSKMVSRPQKWKFWPPLGGHLGGQNWSKIDFKAILKVMFFPYFYGSIFDTIWSQHEAILGQLEPNLTPTWANLRPTWANSKPLKAHS